jgi:hypothetical protein
MKIALCFLISYEHEIHKEHLWIKWIDEIKDIINVYIHYTNYSKIHSPWIKSNVLPEKYICKTDYKHVVSAYFSLMSFALKKNENKWFCFLTDSCCPIISPYEFKKRFYNNYNYSIMKYNFIHWNPLFTNRANLKYIPSQYHLCNNPWFTLCREHVVRCKLFYLEQNSLYYFICKGAVANESIFAIILHKEKNIINSESYIVDWKRMESPTSPYTFRDKYVLYDSTLIEKAKKEEHIMFIRKIGKEFPDEILTNHIFSEKKNKNFNYENLKYFLLFVFIFSTIATLFIVK